MTDDSTTLKVTRSPLGAGSWRVAGAAFFAASSGAAARRPASAEESSVNDLYADGLTRRTWPFSDAWGRVLLGVNTEEPAAGEDAAARGLAAVEGDERSRAGTRVTTTAALATIAPTRVPRRAPARREVLSTGGILSGVVCRERTEQAKPMSATGYRPSPM